MKIRIRSMFQAGAAALALTQVVHAAEPAVSVLGAGMNTCAQYLEAVADAKQDEKASNRELIMFSWVQGSLTGMSLYRDLTGERLFVDLPDAPQLRSALQTKCKAGRTSDLVSVAGHIYLDALDAAKKRAVKK